MTFLKLSSTSPMRLYPWFPVLSPLTLNLFHFASPVKTMLTTMRTTFQKGAANTMPGFSLRRWELLKNWMPWKIASCSVLPLHRGNWTCNGSISPWVFLLSLNSYIFIVVIIFLIWNKIIQVWGVTKQCNDDGCLLRALRRWAGGPTDKKGIAAVTSQIRAFRNHIAKIEVLISLVVLPNRENTAITVSLIWSVAKDSVNSCYQWTAHNKFQLLKNMENFKYIFQKMANCLWTGWAGWVHWGKYTLWTVVQLL